MKIVWIGFALASFAIFILAFLASVAAGSGGTPFVFVSGLAVTNMILSLKEIVK